MLTSFKRAQNQRENATRSGSRLLVAIVCMIIQLWKIASKEPEKIEFFLNVLNNSQ